MNKIERVASVGFSFHILEQDRPQHYSLVVCVISQQYSSATFISLPSLYPKEEFEFSELLPFKFFPRVLNLRNLKCRKPGGGVSVLG
jgi:hypothetical protein